MMVIITSTMKWHGMDGLEFWAFSLSLCSSGFSDGSFSSKKLRPIDVTQIPKSSFMVPY